MKGDKIYCLTCGGITQDLSTTRGQDTRRNPKWRNTCVHCGSVYTINATQFLETNKHGYARLIIIGTNKKELKKYAEKLKLEKTIKKYSIEKHGRKYKLYERIKLRSKLLKKLNVKRKL